MEIPKSLKVSDETRHLLSHMPSREEAMEKAMEIADLQQNCDRLGQEVAKALREYAADGSCKATHELMDASEKWFLSCSYAANWCVELGQLHAIHHRHADTDEEWAQLLDVVVPHMARITVKLHEDREALTRRILQDNDAGIAQIIDGVLSKILRGEF